MISALLSLLLFGSSYAWEPRKHTNQFSDLSPSEQFEYRESHNPLSQRTSLNDNFGDIIFEDNFDSFNFSRWKHVISAFGGGNWEFEYYTNNRTNSYGNNLFKININK